MESRVKRPMRLVAVVLLCLLASMGISCSAFLGGPSDEEILKAIDDSGILKSPGFTLTAPIIILDKGSKDANGAWQVKVRVSMKSTMPDGQVKQMETTPLFKITALKDGQGKTVWKARL